MIIRPVQVSFKIRNQFAIKPEISIEGMMKRKLISEQNVQVSVL